MPREMKNTISKLQARSCAFWSGQMNKMSNEPYIEKEIVTVIRMYNPEYGDDRICQCGHPYYRHLTRLKSKNMRRVDVNTAIVIRLLKGK